MLHAGCRAVQARAGAHLRRHRPRRTRRSQPHGRSARRWDATTSRRALARSPGSWRSRPRGLRASAAPSRASSVHVALSGAHRVGKSTLVQRVADALPWRATVDEPCSRLEEEGHEC